MNTVKIKRNDTLGVFTDTLTADGVAFDLTDYTVYFILRKIDGKIQLKQEADIVSAAAGTVEYKPIAADVITAGTYLQEWEIIKNDEDPLTFPNGEYNKVKILEDLG